MKIFTGQTHGDFSCVLETLYREHDLGVDNVIEMPGNPGHFRFNVFVDGGSNFKVTTGDTQVHVVLL